MRLNDKLEKAFNDQVTMEMQASAVYRQLAIEAGLLGLPGMSAWLRHQADEEIVHANKFIDHLDKRDNHAAIGALPAPKVKKEASPLELFELALQHEEKVSESIRDLYRACEEAGVPHQHFVSNNAMPCGSTIGPISATRLGIRTVDVGIGLLSMHSAREMCGVEDIAHMGKTVDAFYAGV